MNLFEATASLTLNINEYEKNVKEAIKQAQKLSETLAGTSTKSQVASRNFQSLTETLSRIVSGNKQTNSSTEQVTRSISDSGSSAETASRKFSLFGSSVKDSSGNVSLFGEMLKANILSDAISKGFDMIVDGFKAMASAATGFAKESIQVGMSFDSSMSQVAATMGMTVSEMESQVATVGDFTGNLREFAEKMGAETAFSAVQAADALNYMALAGYDVEKSMNMLPNVLNLAAAGGMELATASDMVTDAASALGLTTEETTAMVDKMAMASSKSNTSVSQLGSAILTIGGTAKNLVGGTTELATVLGILADNGIKGSEGGTALRNMILSLTAPTNEAKQQLDELGVSVFDSAGNMRSMNEIFLDMNAAFSQMTQQGRTEAISNIFNKRDLKSVEALLANVGDRYAELSGYIDNAAGAGEKMAKTQLDNLKGDVTIMKSALEGLKISISNEISPTLRGFVQFAGDSFSKLTKAIKRTGLNGVRGILPTIVRNAVNLLKSKIPQFANAITDILRAMGEAIAKNADLIADSFNAIAKGTSDYFLKRLPDFVKNGAKMVSGIAKGISGNLAIMIPAITETVLTIIDELTKPEQITAFIESGIEFVTAIGEGLARAIPIIIERVPVIIDNIKQGLSDNKEKLEGTAISLILFLGESLKEKAAEIKEKAPEIMQKVADTLKNAVPDMLDAGKEFIKKLGKSILNAEIPMSDKIKFGKKISNLLNKFDTVKMNLEIAVKDVPENVKKQWELFTQTLSESFGKVKDSWNELKAVLNIDEFWESGEAGEKAGTALSVAIEGLGATISTTAGAIGNAVAGILKLFTWLADDKKASSLKNTFGAIVGGIVSVNIAIAGATFIGMLSNLPALIAGVTGAFSGLWAVMLSNPVLVVVGAIGAIVGALITAYNTNEEFREYVDNTFKLFSESWGKIVNGENGFVSNVKKFNKELENFGAGIYDFVHSIKEFFSASVDEWARLFEIFDIFIESFKENAITKINELIDSWKTGFDTLVENSFIWGSDLITNFIDGIDSKINPLHDKLEKVGETIYDLLHHSTPEKGYLKDDDKWMPDMMDNFSNGIQNNIHLVTGKIENLASRMKSGFDGIISSAWNWGSDIITNFIDGANSLWDSWVGTWENFGSVIYDLLHHSTPEKGLLKNDDEWMPDMMKNFIVGIRDHVPALRKQAENAVQAIQTAFASPVTMGDIEEIQAPDFETEEIQVNVTFLDNLNELLEKFRSFKDYVANTSFRLNGNFESIDIPAINVEIPDFDKLAEKKDSIETTEIRNFSEIYQNEEYYTTVSETDRKALYRPQQKTMQNNTSDDMQAVIGLLNGILNALNEREIVLPIDTLDTALGLKQSNETRWAVA